MEHYYWQQVWDHLHGIGLLRLSLDGKVERCNRAFAAMLGRTESDIEGLSIAKITAGDDRGHSREKIEQLCRGLRRTYARQKRFLRATGEPAWCQVQCLALWNTEGEVEAIFEAVYEIPQGQDEMETLARCQALERRVDTIMSELSRIKPMEINVAGHQQSADHGGRNEINDRHNDTRVIMWACAAFVAVVLGLAALFLGGRVLLRTDHGDATIEGRDEPGVVVPEHREKI